MIRRPRGSTNAQTKKNIRLVVEESARDYTPFNLLGNMNKCQTRKWCAWDCIGSIDEMRKKMRVLSGWNNILSLLLAVQTTISLPFVFFRPEKMCSRQRRTSNPFYYGGYSTSSPIFYSIPWKPSEYSLTGLGPGSSALRDPLNGEGSNNNHTEDRSGKLGYSKAGFTYYNNNKCICGFLTGECIRSSPHVF